MNPMGFCQLQLLRFLNKSQISHSSLPSGRQGLRIDYTDAKIIDKERNLCNHVWQST